MPLPSKPEAKEVRVLYLKPMKLDRTADAMKDRWKARLEAEYNLKVDMVTEEPPLKEVEDPDMKGYWFRPNAKSHERRLQFLKNKSTKVWCMLYVPSKDFARDW